MGIKKRWNDISKKTKMNLTQFLHAVELVLGSTSFYFDGQAYEQIFGSPMGSPLSPCLADIVMDDLETHCLALLDFVVPFFRRYVDDVFAIIPRSKLDVILEVFNGYHPRLKFTYEKENKGSISFLDTIVIRDKNKLITNWFRKPTFSGRYTNFFSSHPYKYKLNTIISLVDHAILLSDERFHRENLVTVKEILLNNCFPIDVIEKQIKNRLFVLKNRKDSTVSDSDTSDNTFDTSRRIVLPYIKGLSEDIDRVINKAGLSVLHTVPKKLDGIIRRGKDRLTIARNTEVVYKINCNDCNTSYIGQTKRHVETRVKEHRSDITKHYSNHSVVSKHRISLGHDFKWTEPEILHREKNIKKREIAEMFYIKKFNNNINSQKDTENLNPIYDRLISST
jgi:predicted GIY-YIG superfamily endonuclease